MALKEVLNFNNLSHGDAARITGLNRSTVSRVASKDYPNWKEKESEILSLLKEAGYNTENIDEEKTGISLDFEAVVMTPSVSAYKNLASSLADPEGSLSSSLGMVIGTAERGKPLPQNGLFPKTQTLSTSFTLTALPLPSFCATSAMKWLIPVLIQ